MKKIILIPLLLFSLNSCSDKKDFRSFDAKFTYCSDNIDNSRCDDIRPLVLYYNDLYLKSRGVNVDICNVDGMMNTDSCQDYFYTKMYVNDLKNMVSSCRKDFSISYCSTLKEINDTLLN